MINLRLSWLLIFDLLGRYGLVFLNLLRGLPQMALESVGKVGVQLVTASCVIIDFIDGLVRRDATAATS